MFTSKELSFHDSLWYRFVFSLSFAISIHYFIHLIPCTADGDENEWPTDLSDIKNRNIPYCSADFSRLVKKSESKTESALFNITAMVVGIVTGCDITSLSPLTSRDETKNRKKRDSYILNRRDAYNAAVRDSFLDSEDSVSSRFTSPSGYPHHTYHGYQARQRPALNLDVPIRFTEEQSIPQFYSQTPSTFQSTSTIDSDVTVQRRSLYDSNASTLVSSSPSHTTLKRQSSDSSTSNYDTPRTSRNLQRHSVTFEDEYPSNYKSYNSQNKQSPPNTSNLYYDHNPTSQYTQQEASNPWGNGAPPRPPPYVSDVPPPVVPRDYHSRQQEESEPPPPIPPRRKFNNLNGDAHAERPKTLDMGPRNRPRLPPPPPLPTPQKNDTNTNEYPTQWIEKSELDTPYYSTRSSLSPGHTPPHITHHTTLLDIDVDGQSNDSTRPLLRQNAKHIFEFGQEMLY